MKTNFRKNEANTNTEDIESEESTKDLTREEYEEYIVKSGAKGSFMIYRTEKKDEELFIRSINNKECVFVCYENGIAKCSIEKANNDGKTNFKKPISCHLFPIRISDFGGDVLRFEKFEECNPAIEKGAAENVTVAEFCKEPLERHYGKQWYNEFIIAIGR